MDTPDEREQRAEQLVSYAVHTLMHASKVLARVGILLPPAQDLDDPDVLMRAIELALDLIEDAPATPIARSALFAMTLRWLTVVDLIVAFQATGALWRDAAVLDTLNQVEMLVRIAGDLLDERDALN